MCVFLHIKYSPFLCIKTACVWFDIRSWVIFGSTVGSVPAFLWRHFFLLFTDYKGESTVYSSVLAYAYRLTSQPSREFMCTTSASCSLVVSAEMSVGSATLPPRPPSPTRPLWIDWRYPLICFCSPRTDVRSRWSANLYVLLSSFPCDLLALEAQFFQWRPMVIGVARSQKIRQN